eukprot:scaffold1117_cov379-Prasinococcus_capsulatus_cf.AAC.16
MAMASGLLVAALAQRPTWRVRHHGLTHGYDSCTRDQRPGAAPPVHEGAAQALGPACTRQSRVDLRTVRTALSRTSKQRRQQKNTAAPIALKGRGCAGPW